MSIEQNIERIANVLEMLAGKLLESDKDTKAEASTPEVETDNDLMPAKLKKKKKKEKPIKALSFDDVKRAANELVNAFPENKAGFAKAKEILGKFSTSGKMADLKPEKYQEVVAAMQKVIADGKA